MSNKPPGLDLPTAATPVELAGRKFVTKEAFVVLTSLSASTIERLRRKGRIESLQPGGKGTRVLYPIDQLDQLRREAVASAIPARQLEAPAPIDQLPPRPRSGPEPKWKRNHRN